MAVVKAVMSAVMKATRDMSTRYEALVMKATRDMKANVAIVADVTTPQ